MADNVQTLRLRRPASQPKATPAPSTRHQGILQDQVRRSARPPWCPSFSVALRILLLVRVSAAMYSNISDCDEVFNFWEPLHFLDRGYGFQTWEVSPKFALRSWAYISLHLLPPTIARFLAWDKRAAFFGVRVLLGVVSSLCEVAMFRAVADNISWRVGRYFFFMALLSAGMWISSTAFLPSSFSMYANTFAFATALPPPSSGNKRRTLLAVLSFATGAIVGWPFALAVAIPFIIEELLVSGTDIVQPASAMKWYGQRILRLVVCGLVASLIIIPVVAIDTLVYGSLNFPAWNIIKYNIFGGAGRGPDIYGTEPWYFYVFNLILNFNILAPLAFLSLPALVLTYAIDRKRLGGPTSKVGSAGQSSPYTLLAIRLAPFYLWFAIMTSQAHKEERFMFPAYPMLLFNAAITIYLIRGWIETTYIKMTSSPYRASKSSIFTQVTLAIMFASSVLSISRILALNYYYHAPMEVVFKFETEEAPRILNATGLLPPPLTSPGRNEQPRLDISPIKGLNISLCIGKEWYRFPSHWLIPDGVNVNFVKSEFDGLLPQHFAPSTGRSVLDRLAVTRKVPGGLNDLNQEEMAQYVDVSTCQYLIDSDFPSSKSASPHEPRYVASEEWQKVYCAPFLDNAHSSPLTRLLWFPGQAWQNHNSFGDYCLLKRRGLFE